MEHYPSQEPSRIQWIDDTSANLLYPTEETAAEALLMLSEPSASLAQLPPSELRSAQRLSSRPNYLLHVRQATTHDVKQRGAREQSRFYLFNPEYDRGDRRKPQGYRRGREREVTPYKRRRSEPKNVPFDVDLYDDDEESLAKRRDNERSTKRPRLENTREDLFATRMRSDQGMRLRNRSASPQRLANGNGRYGFDGDEMDTAPIVRTRSRANANAGKELLASPAASARSFLRERSPAPKELFPDRRGSRESNLGKELFNNPALASPHHRRTDAFDANDEIDYGMADSPPKPRRLEDRITGGPSLRPSDVQPSVPGFTIKGVAKELNPRVKELFPNAKPTIGDNSGKELFSSKMNQRRRAEDLF